MRKNIVSLVAIFSIIIFLAFQIHSQPKIDKNLLLEINKIKAIDNHSHVEQFVEAGEKDEEGDAIGCGAFEFVSPPPMRLRIDNPIYTGAWREFFDYRAEEMSEKKEALKR